MLKSRFDNFIDFIKNKRVVILTHTLVDIDGLASCLALKYFLVQYCKEQEIKICFSELNKSTKNYLRNISKKFPEFDFSLNKTFNPSDTDAILIVDTNNLKQVELDNNLDLISLNIPLLYIDHHYLGEESENNDLKVSNLIFEDFSSSVEISTTQGDILAYGVSAVPSQNLRPDEIIEVIHSENGLC